MGARAARPAVVVPGLLCTSGALMVLAAAQRWWPACPLGGFDEPACLARQDDAYTFVPPHPDWTPLGDAAALYGAGLVLLAVALTLVPRLLVSTPSRALRWGAWLVGAGVLGHGVRLLVSGVTGELVEVPGVWAIDVLWAAGLPALVALGLVEIVLAGDPRVWWRATATCALVAWHPLVQYFLAAVLLMYVSYDATPWTEAVGGTGLVVSGLGFAVAGRPRSAAPAHLGAVAPQVPTAGR